MVIYAVSLSRERYVADGISKDRFRRSVALDSGKPVSAVVPERVRDGESTDFAMAYPHYRKIVKFASENGQVLKILEALT